MKRLIPYIFITTILLLLIYSIDKEREDNPKKVVDKGYYIPSESTIN